MRIPFGLATALSVLAVLGCSSEGMYRIPDRPLQKAVIFKEQDLNGTWRALSHPPPATVEEIEALKKPETRLATRVPYPSEVDINSVIHVELVKSQLVPENYDLPLPAESRELKARRERLVEALRLITGFIQARTSVMKALGEVLALPADQRKGSGQETSYLALLAQHDLAGAQAATAVLKIWPRDPEMELKLDELWRKDKTFATLNGYLQEKIDELDREYRALTARITLHAYKIRMEAFLDSPGAVSVPLHLEGYDKIEQKEVFVNDRLGLSMSPRARQVFEQASRASVEISAAANAMLQAEKLNREAFSKVANALGGQLNDLVADLDVLVRELGSKQKLKERVAKVRTALDSLKDKAAPELAQGARDAFRTAVDELRAKILAAHETLKDDAEFAIVFEIVEDVRTIREELTPWRPESIGRIFELSGKVRTLIGKHKALLDKLRLVLESVVTDVEKALTTAGATLTATAWKLWNESPAKSEVAALAETVGRIVRVVDTVSRLLGFQPPVVAHTRDPGSIDVPADEAPNTALDLKRTSRLEGDMVTIRTSLLKGQEVVGTPTEATFRVQEFGWHADIQPGVVLVRPNRLQVGDESFAFAPSVAWLHRYHPRPEATDCWAAFNRFIQPSCGFHAVFLNFFPDKEVEIGLGVTLAFWKDWIVAGAGYNLFNEGKRDGDFYYFVGTSLIPILQTVGVLPSAGGGTKP